VRSAGAICAAALLVAACAEPPVKPIPEAAKASVTAVSADVSGIKNSDTSDIGARGSDEGARRGAAQGVAAVTGSGTLLGLLLSPVAAAAGGAKGAADAQSESVVDDSRSNLRVALQETDFTELLRARLATSAAGGIQITDVKSGAGTASIAAMNGAPVSHVMALEYRLGIFHPRHVNPKIGVLVLVTAQFQSADRKQLVHKATWTYCGERFDFVEMASDNAARLRAQIDTAAAVLAEAIPYDLFANKESRPLVGFCMDYNDLPSGRGVKAPRIADLPGAEAPAMTAQLIELPAEARRSRAR
jgi:hypothetical protein